MIHILNGISHAKLYDVIKSRIRVTLKRIFAGHYRMIFYTTVPNFIDVYCELAEIRHKAFRKWDFNAVESDFQTAIKFVIRVRSK